MVGMRAFLIRFGSFARYNLYNGDCILSCSWTQTGQLGRSLQGIMLLLRYSPSLTALSVMCLDEDIDSVRICPGQQEARLQNTSLCKLAKFGCSACEWNITTANCLHKSLLKSWISSFGCINRYQVYRYPLGVTNVFDMLHVLNGCATDVVHSYTAW